jgi:hypothetical protein
MLLMEICLCRGAEVDTSSTLPWRAWSFYLLYTLPCRAHEHALYLLEPLYPLLCTFSEITSHSRRRRSPLSGVMLCFCHTRWTEPLTTSSSLLIACGYCLPFSNPALASAYVISEIDETARGG